MARQFYSARRALSIDICLARIGEYGRERSLVREPPDSIIDLNLWMVLTLHPIAAQISLLLLAESIIALAISAFSVFQTNLDILFLQCHSLNKAHYSQMKALYSSIKAHYSETKALYSETKAHYPTIKAQMFI